jgi:hypothetical protein
VPKPKVVAPLTPAPVASPPVLPNAGTNVSIETTLPTPGPSTEPLAF